MDRMVQRNILAMSGRAVGAAGDVNTLLDKTGTITDGNRMATARPDRRALHGLKTVTAGRKREGASVWL